VEMELIEEILNSAANWNLRISKEQAFLFKKYYQLLLNYNQKFNLTRLINMQEVLEEHFFDSLAGFSNGLERAGNELLDLGSGAGFPGLPIKIYLPEIKLFLLDSARKKIVFLKKIVAELQLDNVFILHMRAEDYGRSERRETFSWVTARALAPLNVAAEIVLPLVKKGGFFWAFKGPNFASELKDAAEIIKRCGGNLEQIIKYFLPQTKKERYLLIFKKIAPTEERFPRRPGIPQKRPL